MKRLMAALLMILVFVLMLMLPGAMAEAVEAAPTVGGIDLTPIFQALIALLASVITIKVIPWVKARTTAQQQEILRAAVSVAVYAAEQLYGTGQGNSKLQYVKYQLSKKGFDIDIEEIEAAVQELSLNQGKIIVPDDEAPDKETGLTD